jgi:hypothetical protein
MRLADYFKPIDMDTYRRLEFIDKLYEAATKEKEPPRKPQGSGQSDSS